MEPTTRSSATPNRSLARRVAAWALPGLFALATCAVADDAPQAARVEVGQTAPAFTLTSSDGEEHSLEGLRGEKDLVVVFFRGTW
ncbi:MAG: hypothetical protein AAGN66_26640 [Acidobacteriota bacterium]